MNILPPASPPVQGGQRTTWPSTHRSPPGKRGPWCHGSSEEQEAPPSPAGAAPNPPSPGQQLPQRLGSLCHESSVGHPSPCPRDPDRAAPPPFTAALPDLWPRAHAEISCRCWERWQLRGAGWETSRSLPERELGDTKLSATQKHVPGGQRRPTAALAASGKALPAGQGALPRLQPCTASVLISSSADGFLNYPRCPARPGGARRCCCRPGPAALPRAAAVQEAGEQLLRPPRAAAVAHSGAVHSGSPDRARLCPPRPPGARPVYSGGRENKKNTVRDFC